MYSPGTNSFNLRTHELAYFEDINPENDDELCTALRTAAERYHTAVQLAPTVPLVAVAAPLPTLDISGHLTFSGLALQLYDGLCDVCQSTTDLISEGTEVRHKCKASHWLCIK